MRSCEKFLFFGKIGIRQDLEDSQNEIESGQHTGLDSTMRRDGLGQNQEDRSTTLDCRTADVIIHIGQRGQMGLYRTINTDGIMQEDQEDDHDFTGLSGQKIFDRINIIIQEYCT
jgi:hypothetical protein